VQALGLSALVFIFDTPLAIYVRRQHDRSKARTISDIKTIERHQATALRQVYDYRDSLSLPLYKIKSGDHRAFAKNFT
jgi:adenylate kinase